MGDLQNQKPILCFRKWRDFRKKSAQSRCLACLQVHNVKELPQSMNGRAIVVGWRTQRWGGEATAPVYACEGTADFDDEIFLHYSTIKCSECFTIWVSWADEKASEMGAFCVDLSKLEAIENGGSDFRGKTMTFNLCGVAAGGELTVSFYYAIVQPEFTSLDLLPPRRCLSTGKGKPRHECFSCLPDWRKTRKAPQSLRADSSGQVSDLNADTNFITIDSSSIPTTASKPKPKTKTTTTASSQSREDWSASGLGDPPSLNSSILSEDGEMDSGKSHQFSGFYQESDVDEVEKEFLRMLEEKPKERAELQPGKKLCVGLDIGLDLELDKMLREAEKELLKTCQVWKSTAGARVLEKAEYEELLKSWRSSESSPHTLTHGGFGSPV